MVLIIFAKMDTGRKNKRLNKNGSLDEERKSVAETIDT